MRPEMSVRKLTLVLLCIFALVKGQNNSGSAEDISNELPPEQIKTFKEEEKEIVSSVNSILRRILPYVMDNSDAVSISPQCTSAMTKIFLNLRKLKGWTLQLLDSIGKPTSGMLRGTSYTMGDYDQCLDITVTKSGQQRQTDSDDVLFTGKYCHILSQPSTAVHSKSKNYKTGKINGSELGRMEEAIDSIPFVPMMPKYMTHLFGLCMPSVCSEDDLTKLLSSLTIPGNMSVTRCEVKQEIEMDYHQRIIIGIFGCFFLLVIAGTLTDFLVRYSTRNTALKYNKGKILSLAVSFSLYSNAERFATENQECQSSRGSCFRGLVVGSVICIIFSNTYFLPHEVFYREAGNLKNLEHYLSQASFAAVVCLSLAVETFFLSIGFFISYKCTSRSDEIKDRTRMSRLKTIFYCYVRMSVPLLFCIGVLFLLPLFGSGPLWRDIIDSNISECRNGWWTYLAMYGNFQSIHEQCFSHLWLVPCIIQTAVAASVVTCICSRCFKFEISLLVIAIVCCNFAFGWLTYTNNLPPSYVPYFAGNSTDNFWKISYSTPLSHFSSCAIGIILGLLTTKKPNLTIKPSYRWPRSDALIQFFKDILFDSDPDFRPANPTLRHSASATRIEQMVFLLMGWIVCLGLLCSVVFLLFILREETDEASLATAFYAALHRTCYSLSIGWIVFVCVFGYGGFINTLLSMKALDPLYRTSYFAYLIHFIVITYHVGVGRERFYYSHVELILRGFAYSCATYILSYVGHILIEMPIKSMKCNILSTAEQIVLNSYSNGLKQADILRSVQMTEHKTHTSFSPDGSSNARKY